MSLAQKIRAQACRKLADELLCKVVHDAAILMEYDHMTTLCAKHVLRAIQRLLGIAPVIDLLPAGFTLAELLVENVLGWLPCEAEVEDSNVQPLRSDLATTFVAQHCDDDESGSLRV